MYIDLTNVAECEEIIFNQKQKGDNTLFDGRGISFDGDVSVSGSYIVEDSIVNLSAVIRAKLKGSCDKCLAGIEWEINLPLEETFLKKSDSGTEEEACFTYEGYKVELDDVVAERILFNIPSQLLCKKDCKGLCPKCGCDLNYADCDCNKIADENSPFAILKSIVGGAKNGSTKV